MPRAGEAPFPAAHRKAGDRRRQAYPTADRTALIERCRKVLARLHRRTDGREFQAVSWPSNTRICAEAENATSQTPPSAVLSRSDPKKLSRKVVLRQRPLIAEVSWAAPLRRWWTGHRAAASAALKTVIDASFSRPLQALFRERNVRTPSPADVHFRAAQNRSTVSLGPNRRPLIEQSGQQLLRETVH